MKKAVFLLLSFFLISNIAAQNTEFSFHLNSGLFSFGGESATRSSVIIVSDVATIDNYTNNPYGKEKTFSYGMGGQVQRITNQDLIYGFQAGYELLKSQVQILGLSGEFIEPPIVQSGQSTLTHGFIYLHPLIGKRFSIKNLKLDLSMGPEFGFNIISREHGEATAKNNFRVKTNTERNDPGTDVRIRPSLTVGYKNWGVSAGYSYGLHNYSENLVGADQKQYSRLVRFGVHYTMN